MTQVQTLTPLLQEFRQELENLYGVASLKSSSLMRKLEGKQHKSMILTYGSFEKPCFARR